MRRSFFQRGMDPHLRAWSTSPIAVGRTPREVVQQPSHVVSRTPLTPEQEAVLHFLRTGQRPPSSNQ